MLPKQFQNGWNLPLRNSGWLLCNRSARKIASVVLSANFYVEKGDPFPCVEKGNMD